MIDFRYHLVSLISVFLALAVGIALGSGPLKETVSGSLTSQVDSLRKEKDDLRTQRDAATEEANDYSSYIDAAAPDLLADALTGKNIAVVVLPGADTDTVSTVASRINQAGGTVTGTVSVTDKWTDPNQQTFNSVLVGQMLSEVTPSVAADASLPAQMAATLAYGLTGPAATDPATLDSTAQDVLRKLESGGLISYDNAPTASANGILLATAGEITGSKDGGQKEITDRTNSYVTMADTFATRSSGCVATGPSAETKDVLAAIRADKTASAHVSTVDSIDNITGEVSAPLALAAQFSGTVGQYGFRDGATAKMPARPAAPAATGGQ